MALSPNVTSVVQKGAAVAAKIAHQTPAGIAGRKAFQSAANAGRTEQANRQSGQESAPTGAKATAKAALAKVATAMNAMTALEQKLSLPFASIPFPAFPAARFTDKAFGLPHAHSHPPNFIPPAPPVPLPSIGPILYIPYVSCATTVFINNLQAARCGDMGIGIWCGGFFPFYEIMFGSSSVWIEGSRAARMIVDITKHCIMSTKPSDPPIGPTIGTIITGSPNVMIGGVPLPSLTSFGIGKAMGAFAKVAKTFFKGLAKVAAKIINFSRRVVKNIAKKLGSKGIARYMGGLRRPASRILTEDEIAQLTKEFVELGGDPKKLRFNKGNQTGYVDSLDVINVRGDVLPLEHSTHPRSRMSSKAVLAHELGHQKFRGTDLPPGHWEDEYRASHTAATETPGLSDVERADLMGDAIERAREAGQDVKMDSTIRKILYGYD